MASSEVQPRAEEFQLNLGAISANTAAGFHLDNPPYINAFGRSAYIDWVLVDNGRSGANLTLISEPSRPDVLAGERKRIDLNGRAREVYLEADAAVNAGEARITVGIIR